MTNLIFLMQDTLATTAETPVDAAATGTESFSYFSMLLKGGVMVIPILLLLFFTLYVIVERILYIKKVTKEDTNLINDIQLQLSTGKVENAQLVATRSNTAYGNILESGISHIGRPLSEIEGSIEKATNVEIALMEKKLGYLGLVAGIAPILGFIGTISGVIRIFYEISQSADVSIKSISGGLYEKMISSGLGLIAGVIAYAGYHLLNMMIDDFGLKVQKQVIRFVNIITTGK